MAHLPPEPSPERHHGIDDIPVWTRRGVVLGMCVTAAAALTVGERVLFPARRWLGEVEEEATPRGSLAWARSLAKGTDGDLWRERHEFVWAAVAHPGDAVVAVGLDRLADLALATTKDAGGPILGHMVNALRSRGDRSRLQVLAQRLGAREDLSAVHRMAERALAEMGR